jgi:nucleoside-diphosphate-sugar epimerase
MRIAVTGAGSFIGSALHTLCQTRGIEWVGIDVAPPGPRHRISADIGEPGWEAALPDGVDALVHLAAISRDADCRRDPARAIAVNLTGTWNAIAAARARSIPQIVFASSEWVYGDIDAAVKNEETVIDAASLRSEYPLTKLAGERLLWMAAQPPAPALAATVLRFGIVYGPRPGNWSAVESMYDAVARRERIEVGSLDTARRFIHVDDIAAGIVAALGRPPGFELFNLTGNRLLALGDIIGESVRLHGRSPAVEERTPGRPSIRNIDNSKARRVLGWEPRIGLRAGLESLAAAAQQEEAPV